MSRHFLRRARGFGLITAIMLLVLLAALGAAIVNFYTGARVSADLDIQGARAYQAARAGVEWGLYQQLRGAGGSACIFTSNSFSMPSGSQLASFTVTVSCTVPKSGNVNQAGTGPDRFRITAVACNQPDTNGQCPNATPALGTDYVKRSLSVDF